MGINTEIKSTFIPVEVADDRFTPQLQMSRRKLEAQANHFIEGFPGETSYAVKANSDVNVVRILAEAGVAVFDVASLEEMATVREAAPDAVLHYHNPVKSRDEITLALTEFGCRRFAVDHESELEKIAELAADTSVIEIAVRFRLESDGNAVQSFSSKFGANIEEAIHLLRRAHQLGLICGLTFHPGSQTLSPDAYCRHIEAAGRISRTAGIPIAFLNVGGGFPSHYRFLDAPALPVYFQAIKDATVQAFGEQHPKLECEPGRGMVGRAGRLIASIKCVRGDRREAFLNDGIYGGLMEWSQFPALHPEYAHRRNGTGQPGPVCDWTVYGPTCDPIDVLPARLSLPEDVCDGDLVIFDGLGAYSTATATRFNGYGALATVIVS